MTRCTCDIPNCDGIECYVREDFPPEVETPEVRKPYEPSPEYRAWLRDLGLTPRPDEIGDPFEKKRRKAA